MTHIEIDLTQTLPQLRPVELADNIRVGNTYDGGYVIPRRILDDVDHLLSFGLGQDCSFELGMQMLVKGISIDVYDHTVVPPSPKTLLMNLLFSILYRSPDRFRNYLKFSSDYKKLFRTAEHRMQRVNSHAYKSHDRSISEILDDHKNQQIALKIDIEGDEFKILGQIVAKASNIKVMVVEFHEIEAHFELFKNLLATISELFTITHVHANNFGDLNRLGTPDVLEVTFLPRKIVSETDLVSVLPLVGLDYPSESTADDFILRWS